MKSPNKLTIDSAAAYEANATAFLQARDQSDIGAAQLRTWAQRLPAGAEVLELACGGGFPVTRELHAAGLRLWAVESSSTLAEEFRQRFPTIPVQCERVQDADFFQRQYQAVVAIGLLFLLSENDQVDLIGRVGSLLQAGGRFLFTAPLAACEWVDITTGIASHALGHERYLACLQLAGLRLMSTWTDEGGNDYWEAERLV